MSTEEIPEKKSKISENGSPSIDQKLDLMMTQMNAQFEAQKLMMQEQNIKIERLQAELRDAKIQNPQDSVRKFTLKHTFKDLYAMPQDCIRKSEDSYFFGADWRIELHREGVFDLLLSCSKEETSDWSITTNSTVSLILPTVIVSKKELRDVVYDKNTSSHGFPEWDNFVEYVENDEVTIEIEVRILKTTGFAKRNNRKFDGTYKEHSDVVLVVEGEEFFVQKDFLAVHSLHFRNLLFSKYQEADKDRVELPDISARDFQNFLGVLYGSPEIDDPNVEGILHLACLYDVPSVTLDCEKYLFYQSELPWKKRLQLSAEYNLRTLMEECPEHLNTKEELDVDPKWITSGTVAKKLFQKTFNLMRD